MALRSVHVEGLSQFRKALKEVDSEFGKMLRQVHVEIADLVHGRAQAATPRRNAKAALKAKGTQKGAFLVLTSGRRGDSLAVFTGAKRRSGWYAARKFKSSSGKQFKPWIGNAWDVGDDVPYYVGPAINNSIDDVIEVYGDGIDRLAKEAFPD